jgi:hypothetical protein
MSNHLADGSINPFPQREHPSEEFVHHSELGLCPRWKAESWNNARLNQTIFRADDVGIHPPVKLEGAPPRRS